MLSTRNSIFNMEQTVHLTKKVHNLLFWKQKQYMDVSHSVWYDINVNIHKNRTLFLNLGTSFHQLSNMTSSGLKKMLS